MEAIILTQFLETEWNEPPAPTQSFVLEGNRRDTGVSLLMKLVVLVRKIPMALDLIRTLPFDPISINHRTPTGFTALYLAVLYAGSYSSPMVVRILLARGANYLIPTSVGSLLHLAIVNIHYGYSCHSALKLLLEVGMNPNAMVRGCRYSALGTAAWYNDVTSIQMLVQFGATSEYWDRRCGTPLMAASRNNSLDAIATLIQLERFSLELRDEDGCTSLSLAAYHGHIQAVEMLISHRAELNAPNRTGLTPLWMASLGGSLEMVSYLLQQGADHTVRRSDGRPLIQSTLQFSPAIRKLYNILIQNEVTMNRSMTSRLFLVLKRQEMETIPSLGPGRYQLPLRFLAQRSMSPRRQLEME